LNWDYQKKHVSNKIASSIFALNQIKNFLPLNIRPLVYNALVRPHIEYGIITWGGGEGLTNSHIPNGAKNPSKTFKAHSDPNILQIRTSKS